MGLNWILTIITGGGLLQLWRVHDESYFRIFAFSSALLFFFTLLITWMKKVGKKSADELMARTISFWWMLTCFLIAVLSHQLVSYFLISALSVMSAREYFSFRKSSIKSGSQKSIEGFVFFLLGVNLILLYFGRETLSLVLLLISLSAILPSLLVLSNSTDQVSGRYGWYAQAIVYFVFALGSSAAILNKDLKFLIICILLTELRDLISYWIGKFLSRVPPSRGLLSRMIHWKIAEQISPNKSWMTGVLATLALVLLMTTVGRNWLDTSRVGSSFLVAWPLAIGFFGLMGDLVFSLLKREHHLKDSGNTLPGKEGLLDRIDGLILTLPVTYLLLRYFDF